MTKHGSVEWRRHTIQQLQAQPTEFDLIVVGGGITGAGIYREAVLRGLRVLLVEQQDFAWGTSSRSSKMVHGGLRYLASGQFGIAHESASERQKLLSELKGLVEPLPFLMSHYRGQFPGPWLFDKLLSVYDWMAETHNHHYWKTDIASFFAPGINTQQLTGATQFADASVDDARLVLRVMQDANQQGGIALNYLQASDLLRDNDRVVGVQLCDRLTNQVFPLRASVVINATGAWSDQLRSQLGQHNVIRPLRGSHLLVPFWRLPVAYSVTFNHPVDQRPVFVFPWQGVSIIGTTDLDHHQPLSQEASITNQEVDYLLQAANSQFPTARLNREHIVSCWSGVRPVVSHNPHIRPDMDQPLKPSDEKREHVIWDDNGLISVAGGKLTTFRLIALDVLKHASHYLPEPLPANSLKHAIRFSQPEQQTNPKLQGRFANHAQQLAGLTAELEWDIHTQIPTTPFCWAELIWSCQHEMVIHLDDLLLRRTRLGLLLADGAARLMPQIKAICQHYLPWDEPRWQHELTRYQTIIKQHYSLPQEAVSQ